MQIFISHSVFSRQPAEFFFSKKNRQMNKKYDITYKDLSVRFEYDFKSIIS